jgi:hypothetical protein
MSYNNIANATFGKTNRDFYESDIINRRKAKNLCKNYCNYVCSKNVRIKNYHDYNLINTLYTYGKIKRNKYDLIAGLYTQLDLDGVCVVINGNPCDPINTCDVACATPAIINTTLNFTEKNTIDPKGLLFGKNPCGINNYIKYMKPR